MKKSIFVDTAFQPSRGDMLDYDIEKSILELSLRKTSLQKEIEEIDLQIAFLYEEKNKMNENKYE